MIKRSLFKSLKDHLQQKEITLIIGPRQAGKTTLMKLLKEELDKKGEKTLFLSLDTEADQSFFSSQQRLLQKIRLEIGKNKGYVFIDEIQRKENASIFLKGLYDMDLPYKFIVSGSGSVELKEKVHESLVGRKRLFEIATVSFEEFVDYRLNYKYTDNLTTFFSLHQDKSKELFEEYLNFGGYPRVILAETLEEKRQIIADIYQSYLEKDIVYLLNIQKTESLIKLVKILSSQIGNLVNVSELSSILGISVQTVNDYLWYLEKTFIIQRITPYFKNIRKEITKMNIMYFNDLGLRNYALGQFGIITYGLPSGFLFENFIFNNLKEHLRDKLSRIHFWRTKDKAEVDFMIETPKELIPLEVKYQVLKTPETSRSFKSFLINYHPARAYVIHLGKEFSDTFNKTNIFFTPYYKIIDIFKNLL